MNRLLLLSFPILLLFGVFITKAYSATAVSGHKIVVDAGHGGTDFGSTECSGLPEKDANLDIALRLKSLLEADGAQVFVTRTDDSTLSNGDRYNYANSVNGEALVSIHLNGSTNHNKDGTQGLYGKRNKDKAFTDIVHKRLAKELGVPDLGITNFASGVLLKSDMPATIQEAVFISNTDECSLLKNGGGTRQQQIAQSLYNGLVDWFSK